MVSRLCKNILLYYSLSYVSILNILITSFFRQHVKVVNVHPDLRQLAYGLVKVRSYGRYDINGFRFHSTAFVSLCPLAATTNSGVVTRTIDVEGHETNYYGIINKILVFNFVRNKELKVVFFIVIGLIVITELGRTSSAW
jgi:hypothetical protein